MVADATHGYVDANLTLLYAKAATCASCSIGSTSRWRGLEPTLSRRQTRCSTTVSAVSRAQRSRRRSRRRRTIKYHKWSARATCSKSRCVSLNITEGKLTQRCADELKILRIATLALQALLYAKAATFSVCELFGCINAF